MRNLGTEKAATFKSRIAERRIVLQHVVNMGLRRRIIPAIVPENVVVGNSANVIEPLQRTDLSLEALLGLLGSTTLNWRFRKTSTNNNVNIYELEFLPVPSIPEVEMKRLTEVVRKILAITKDEDYLKNTEKQAKVKELEREIDQLVYKLYGLTEEEIKIVEGEVNGKP